MKKMVKNQKGFSLIELLIVIAIMGVLAAIAFGMFSGVLGNAKKRADAQTANVLERAFLAYLVDSQDWNLDETFFLQTRTSSTGTALTDGSGWRDVALALQTQLQNKSTGPDEEYGPYLSPEENASPSATHFAPQWNGPNQYVGYRIEIYQENQQVKVTPTRTAADAVIDVLP